MNCEVARVALETLHQVVTGAPDPQVAWFFQKGLGSRLLLNALNRFRPGFEDLWNFFGYFRSV